MARPSRDVRRRIWSDQRAVNNAGITGPSARTADLSVRDYLAVMSIDAYGVYLGMRTIVPAMLRGAAVRS